MPRLDLASIDAPTLEHRVVRARNRLRFELAPKGDRDASRIFVIGHPRTGTGTLHRIFLANGLDSVHSPGSWRTAEHECFSDRGNYQPVQRLATTYPDAWFVLNTRPAWKYVRSMLNHVTKKRRRRGWPAPRYTARNVANEIRRRNRHFVACVRLFEQTDVRFVVANIEIPGAFDFICHALGLEYPGIEHNRGAPSYLDDAALEHIDAGFRRLGLEADSMNPFIFNALLDADERRMVDRFLEHHADRVRL